MSVSKLAVEKKILKTVKQTILVNRMLTAGDAVLVAVSGGPDSVALVNLMYELAPELSLRLGIAHLNHGLRSEASDRDAEFVAGIARRLELPFYVEKKNVFTFQKTHHLCLEEAARIIRYEFLESIAARNRFNKIATGHHSNDNAELILMNLLRGSGPLGLSGIPPIREGKIVRPLFNLKRTEILNYIAEKKLACISDASNLDFSIRRNRIRDHLIPELEKSYNPAIVETINRLGSIMRAENRWFENEIKKDFNQCTVIKSPNTISIDRCRLAGLATAAQRRIIRKAIAILKGDLRRITLLHINAVLALIDKKPARGSLDLPDGIQVVLNDAILTINRAKEGLAHGKDSADETAENDYHYIISRPGQIFIKETGTTIKLSQISVADLPDFSVIGKNMAFFDWDCLQFPLVMRNMRPGDRCSPLGIRGTQTVKKFFINQKVPIHQRRLCPLMLCGNQIIWIVGHRIDNFAKIVATTRRVLKAELFLA